MGLLVGEENFIRLEDSSSEDFQTSPSILKELLRLKPDSADLYNQLRSAFADSDTKGSNPEGNYADDKESLVIKETRKGRCYLQKRQVMQATLFLPNGATAPTMLEEAVAQEEEEEEKELLQPPSTPKASVVKEEDTEDDEDDDFLDDESDDEMMYTSDSVSES